MSAKIQTLIDKQDNSQIIRDEVAGILAVEVASQKVLATAAGKDPALWDFDIYIERTSPWFVLENSSNEIIGEMPLVNVYFDQTQAVGSASDNIEVQKMNGSFIIDAYAAKNHQEDGLDVLAADELTALETQRILKLVRNILMSGIYIYIFTSVDIPSGLPIAVSGIVSKRSFSQIQMFQPQINDRPAQHVVGARMTLQVEYLEFSPQIEGPNMELLISECIRDGDGKVLFTIAETTI